MQRLTNALSEHLYLAIVEQLEEQDMAQLDQITDDVQREAQMRQLFETKTGQNLQTLSDGFVKSFVDEFLAGYHQQTSPAPTG